MSFSKIKIKSEKKKVKSQIEADLTGVKDNERIRILERDVTKLKDQLSKQEQDFEEQIEEVRHVTILLLFFCRKLLVIEDFFFFF